MFALNIFLFIRKRTSSKRFVVSRKYLKKGMGKAYFATCSENNLKLNEDVTPAHSCQESSEIGRFTRTIVAYLISRDSW